MGTFALAFASIAISVIAQFLLREGVAREANSDIGSIDSFLRLLGEWFSNVFVLSGLLLYIVGALVWLNVLSRMDVSKAYPLVGLGFVLTVCVGYVLGEAVTVQRAIGVLMIAAGVWIVARS